MDAPSAADLSARVRKWVSEDASMKEANVKLRIIQPLLDRLGWDASSGDVEMEWSRRLGTKPWAVDYALLVNQKAAVIVEAKSFDSGMDRVDEEQVISYGRMADVRWGVLTNGKQLRVYDCTAGTEPEVCLVSEVDLQHLEDGLGEVNLLSKESLITQEIGRAVELRKSLRSSASSLEQSRPQVTSGLAELLRKAVPHLPASLIDEFSQRGFGAIETAMKQAEALSRSGGSPGGGSKPAPSRSLSESQIPTCLRKDLQGNPDATIIVCPAKIELGLSFLPKYQAWAFIQASRRPQFFALYVGRPESEIRFFAEVESMTPPLTDRSQADGIQEKDMRTFGVGKRILWLKPNSLRRLADPIPAGVAGSVPQRSRYTNLAKFKLAHNTGDLWEA